MRHIEFLHNQHFEKHYYRVGPAKVLSHFIDFFWETKFESLWEKYPKGFSDALFPNTGYTYLINLGTPFVMQVGNKKFEMRTDGFLPRPHAIECFHSIGNRLFGIKFKISPVLFLRSVNFAEYRNYIYPLSYLMEQRIIDAIKKAPGFRERVDILNTYFIGIIKQPSNDSRRAIRVVSSVLQHCDKKNDFSTSVELFAARNKVSVRSLHRYFETVTSLSCKKAIQVLRIRKAVQHLANKPETFSYSIYGYYDHSHFYKHLREFLKRDALRDVQLHLLLLKKARKQSTKKTG